MSASLTALVSETVANFRYLNEFRIIAGHPKGPRWLAENRHHIKDAAEALSQENTGWRWTWDGRWVA